MKDNKVLSIVLYVIIALACVAIVLSCIALFAGKKLTSNDNTTGNGTETKTYSISFDSESGSEVQSIVSESGKPISEPIPVKEGMIFDGWYTSNDGGVTLSEKFDFGYMPESDVQLYAKWKEPTIKRNVYVYADYEIHWVESEKTEILETIGMTEDALVQTIDNLLDKYPSIWFDAYTDGVAVLGGFDPNETIPYTSWYKLDSENVLHFYDSKENMEADKDELKNGLYEWQYTVSSDCGIVMMKSLIHENYNSYFTFAFRIAS